MAPGEAWYLDTRKPHTARNDGEEPRVHLVIDAEATPDLLDLLRRGEEAR
jgi:aspartyl/asparaginyl beta-hydroxylase (cupin superfamily)